MTTVHHHEYDVVIVGAGGAGMRAAIEAVLAGASAPSLQKASLGCNIKWRPGNEPAWFARG